MEIQVKEVEYCKVEVSCTMDQEEVSSKKSEVLKIFKDAPVPGFRKGKATSKIIENFYKNQINDALKKALMEDCYHQSIFEKQFKPLGLPNFTQAFLEGNGFTCQFQVRKTPEFELVDFRSLEIESPKIDVTVESIKEKNKSDLQNLYGERIPLGDEDYLAAGNIASLSYDVFVDGNKSESMSSDGDVVTVGTSKIAKFDENVIGMKVGESKEFTISVPENADPELANKDLVFNLRVNMGMKLVPAEWNVELAEKAGKESLEQLEAELNKKAQSTYQGRLQALKNSVTIRKLIEAHTFKVPDWLSIAEAKMLLKQNKMDWDTANDNLKAQAISQSEKSIKISLILEKVRDSEPDAQLSDTELLQYAKNYLALTQKGSVESMMKDLNNSGQLQVLLKRLQDENAINFVVNAVKFI